MICFMQIGWASSDNIAGDAKVSTSSELGVDFSASGAIDGLIGLDGVGEWACKGETVFWGYIKYPWLKLQWQQKQSIDKILLYDRVADDAHTAGGTLIFSDGSEVVVTAIPNDGTARLVTFAPKHVDWVKFQVTDGDGKDLGLSEIEVFPATKSYKDLVEWVDPFIETTKGRYFFFTPGSTPFGMIAAAPHTRIKNQWGGGYNYNSMEILGFGQLHGWMMSGLDIMPTTGGIDPTYGRQAWKSGFSHDDEIAQPGYHRVYLRKYKMWIENTTTERVSFYKMHFTEADQADILINLGGYIGSTTMTKAKVTKKSNFEFEGSFVSAGRMWGGPNEIKVFFVAQFDKPFQSFDGWVDSENMHNITQLTGPSTMNRMDSMTFGKVTQSYWNAPSAGVVCNYKVDPGDQLKMKIAISFTSIHNARANLESECNHWDFDTVRQDTRKKWNNWLGKIEVKGGKVDQKVKFYTDLWHVLLGRQIIDDVSGEYPDYTQGERDWNFTDAKMQIKRLPKNTDGMVKYHMYNSDALWLTQWNLNILWGLAWPSVLDDFSASMVQYADNGGLLPRGPCVGGYSYIMTGCPSTNMIVSAFMKDQLTKVDAEHAFSTIVRNHQVGGMMGEEDEVRFYLENGWCPDNAGKSIEWYFQDWSAAQMAKKLGKEEEHNAFLKRSAGWKDIYHPDHKLLFPKRKSGEWLHDDPLSGAGWVEANAWQGTWSLSHDIPTLAKMMGGNEVLCQQLDHAFEQAAPDDFVFGYGSGYVSYANQPGCSNAHVFNLAGAPWLSQYWVRRVNEQAYGGTTPDQGYGGHDEDQGQMGGVSALMSMGLFSVKGNGSHTPIYEITSPVFDEIIIHLDPVYYTGESFTIKTYNNSKENMYIQKAKLNGEDHQAVWFTHETFSKGGLLELWLDDTPNKSWGKEPFPN
ncbi:MAG: glycoside hydrolase family 92 protein [Saprospiraceae bacterium]|nr:glycoside hydrolase family 92 protein [Saprospiraceae bacterium]